MTNTSATGGYVAPTVITPPEEDADLDAILQQVIVGITGLDGTLVRRAFQAIVPKQPDVNTNWCAFFVSNTAADVNPTVLHDGTANGGLGASTESRTEDLEVTTTFYGPNARSYAALLRDGLGMAQNRDALRANRMAFVACDPLRLAADLVNQQWIRRVDLTVHLRRMVIRTYPIENVVSLQATTVADCGSGAGETTITTPITTGL